MYNINADIARLENEGLIKPEIAVYLRLSSTFSEGGTNVNYPLGEYYKPYPGDGGRFILANKIAALGLCTTSPLPNIHLTFTQPQVVTVSEEEARRSKNTVNPSAYLLYALQVDANADLTVTINSAFKTRWGIDDKFVNANLPGILVKFYETQSMGTVSTQCAPLAITWSAAAIHNAESLSRENILSLKKLGLSGAATLFALMRLSPQRSPVALSLNQVYQNWGFEPVESIRALSALQEAHLLGYTVETINLVWLRTIPVLTNLQLTFLQGIMPLTERIMHWLNQLDHTEPISTIQFCLNHSIPSADLFRALAKLKAAGIINPIFEGVIITWGSGYEPPADNSNSGSNSGGSNGGGQSNDSGSNSGGGSSGSGNNSGGYGGSGGGTIPTNASAQFSPNPVGFTGYSQAIAPISSNLSTFTVLTNEYADDVAYLLPDIGFDFSFFTGIFRNNIYISSNSCLTFGYSSTNYVPYALENDSIWISLGDRSVRSISTDFTRPGRAVIRYEGSTSYSSSGYHDIIWETTLFASGCIQIVTKDNTGWSQLDNANWAISHSETEKVAFPPSLDTSVVLLRHSDGTYTAHLGSYDPSNEGSGQGGGAGSTTRSFSNQAVNDSNYSTAIASPLGAGGMEVIVSELYDDAYFQLPDIGFDFLFYSGFFRNDIYIGSNSYVTFGYTTSSKDLETDVNYDALYISAGDRRIKGLYIDRRPIGMVRIRFEGYVYPYYDGEEIAWELTLFENGNMQLVTEEISTDNDNWVILQNTSVKTPYPSIVYSSAVFIRRNSDEYTVHPGSYTVVE